MYMSREYESAGDETVVPHLLRFLRRVVEYWYLDARKTLVGLASREELEDIFDRLIKVTLHFFLSFIIHYLQFSKLVIQISIN